MGRLRRRPFVLAVSLSPIGHNKSSKAASDLTVDPSGLLVLPAESPGLITLWVDPGSTSHSEMTGVDHLQTLLLPLLCCLIEPMQAHVVMPWEVS